MILKGKCPTMICYIRNKSFTIIKRQHTSVCCTCFQSSSVNLLLSLSFAESQISGSYVLFGWAFGYCMESTVVSSSSSMLLLWLLLFSSYYILKTSNTHYYDNQYGYPKDGHDELYTWPHVATSSTKHQIHICHVLSANWKIKEESIMMRTVECFDSYHNWSPLLNVVL